MKICLSCEGVTSAAAQRCGHCGAWLLPTDAVHYPQRRGERDAGNPLLGTIVDGKYRLSAVLGRGGHGTVFQAQHVGTLVTVALKLLHPRFAERPEYRRALLPEARRAATVTHAGCARLLDVGEVEEGVAYLAMELVEGDTLDALLRGGRLAGSHAVAILAQIAAALEAIHAAGLVHCDLSPRNVMVAARGGDLRVKVLDFGIARTATLAGAEKTRAGELAGFVNPVFSAPEVLAGEDVDVRADVYSFGSLAWLMLTGDPPVDDADPQRAALAVAAGTLRPWPRVPGVPRRLQRLVARCVAHDRARRPSSATELRRELAIVAGARRPAIARAGAVALGLSVMATLMSGTETPEPFLRLRVGSALELADLASPKASVVQHLPSRRLETLGLHFGGFRADHLRVDVSRGGLVLLRAPLQPEVDAASGALTLSSAQAQWRELLEGLVRTCRDGPVDLSFVVPGRAPFGVARLLVDDEPPVVECAVEPEDAPLTGAARLSWRCNEGADLVAISAQVSLGDGRSVTLPLPAAEGTLDLGVLLAQHFATPNALGPGRLTVTARDRAGNQGAAPPIAFHDADLEAPAVVELSGPRGESFVPVVAGTARLRVRLSQLEAHCVLRIASLDQIEVWRAPLSDASAAQEFDVPVVGADGRAIGGAMWFVVEDAVGNRSQRQFPVVLRDRDVRVDCVGVGPGSTWIAGELVLADVAAAATFTVDSGHRIVRADLGVAAPAVDDAATLPIAMETEAQDRVRLQFPALRPGGHVLRLAVEELGSAPAPLRSHAVPVRVLPPAIEVRVPAARSRFLPGLLAAGILARRGDGYGEGPGWRVDPALLPYVRGTLWLGAATPVPLSLPERTAPTDPLLPEVLPVPGHNVFAVELRDVLDRRAQVFVGDERAPTNLSGGRSLDVVADFWWNDAPALPVGEELLVEYGLAAALRVRLPLPFAGPDADEVLLGIAQSEIPASEIEPAGDGSIARFEVPFAAWSVAGGLVGRSREEFAGQLTGTVRVTISTPAGRYSLDIRLRTTRSTLEPVALAEIADLRDELGAIRLLPVLAPSGPFPEPVPAGAPPRALFRPQVAMAVRDITDFLLQDREFTCGAARELLVAIEAARTAGSAHFVHHDDPLGAGRLRRDAMLPAIAVNAPADAPLVGVDYYQAYTYCRLLGFVVGEDPELFRLPLGCELELAAFAGAGSAACNGVAAHGGAVSMAAFLDAERAFAHGLLPGAAIARQAGDVVPAGSGASFLGLDFGVREWVCDLPHVPSGLLLLREWISDHATHLARVAAFASGAEAPPPDLAGPLRRLGVVRGLALGETDGLIDGSGQPIDPSTRSTVPGSVPGVLRSEQLRRDGSDLLSAARDARLQRTGFRVATPATLVRARGRR